MNKRKIGDIAIELMKEENSDSIGYDWYGGLDEVFDRALKEGLIKEPSSYGGRMKPHPLNRQLVILNCLDRDKRFDKKFIRCCTSNGAERLVRIFYLKDHRNEK